MRGRNRMFKNYLSYSLALSFHQSCLSNNQIEPKFKERLMRSSETMIHHFAAAVHTQDPVEESKNLFVTLVCLRDCKETLDEAGILVGDLPLQFQVLHARLEEICLKAALSEDGQLRMLG